MGAWVKIEAKRAIVQKAAECPKIAQLELAAHGAVAAQPHACRLAPATHRARVPGDDQAVLLRDLRPAVPRQVPELGHAHARLGGPNVSGRHHAAVLHVQADHRHVGQHAHAEDVGYRHHRAAHAHDPVLDARHQGPAQDQRRHARDPALRAPPAAQDGQLEQHGHVPPAQSAWVCGGLPDDLPPSLCRRVHGVLHGPRRHRGGRSAAQVFSSQHATVVPLRGRRQPRLRHRQRRLGPGVAGL
ncbi:hypothetical protein ON010_g10418 [Phytophthora cinnamomi]|nr:hypothetical protein ON010_g10418 [Phytophthora cinnamomi]